MSKIRRMGVMGIRVMAVVFCIAVSTTTHAQEQINSILQKETIRRQELVLRAAGELKNAEELLKEGKDEEAIKIIERVLASIPETGQASPVYEHARRLMVAHQLKQAMAAMEKKDWFLAKDMAEKILQKDPQNQEALKIVMEANNALGIKKDGSSPNPAIDPKFVKRVNEVQDFIQKGKDFQSTGQYDKAEESLENALAVDPYNEKASEILKKVQDQRQLALDEARKLKHLEKAVEVRESWSERLKVESSSKVVNAANAPLTRSSKFNITRKLRSLLIPEIKFENATIQDAVQFLNQQSQILDETGEGVSFVIRTPKVKDKAASFSLKLKNVPMGEALRYITALAGVKPRIEEFAVFIVSLDEPQDVLVTRNFTVRPSFFESEETAGENEAGGNGRRIGGGRRSGTRVAAKGNEDSIKKALEDRGVSFAKGASATYNASTGILTVKNTQDQIDLIEEIVYSAGDENLLVRIQTRFVEVNQEDLDDITFNWFTNGAGVGAALDSMGQVIRGFRNGFTGSSGSTGTEFGEVLLNTGLKGSKQFSTDTVDGLLNLDSAVDLVGSSLNSQAAPNRLSIFGEVVGTQYALLLDALDQKKSTDLITAPEIVVNNGAQGIVSVIREFLYPTDFDAPQIQQPTDAFLPATIIPAWPTSFEKRNVGVEMTVYPRISVDRKRVLLDVKPDVVQFDGFINYGSRIVEPGFDFSGEQTFLASLNEVNQPVFSIRTIENARVEIQDGHTMALGGLIREDVDLVDEKVPVLGDIPWIGRAFRSKAERAIKKNLLIFISVQILRPDGQPYNMETVATAAPSPAQG